MANNKLKIAKQILVYDKDTTGQSTIIKCNHNNYRTPVLNK